MKNLNFTLVFLIFQSLQIFAQADLYVSPTGNDATGNGSINSPWASLSHACSQAVSGDKIHINPGNYTDNNQCILAPGVDIEGAGRDVVTITSNVATEGWWYLLAESSPVIDGNHIISGFTLDGDNRTLANGMKFTGRNNVQVHHVNIQNIDAYGLQIYSGYSATKTVPPAEYINNTEVNNCTIKQCGRLEQGAGGLGEYVSCCLSVGGMSGAAIHDNIINEDIGGGIIFWEEGWFKGCYFYNNDLTVTGPSDFWDSQIAMELWNLYEDCKIYNNTSNNWFSLVKGGKGSGTHSVEVYDNRIVFDDVSNKKEGIEAGLGLYDVVIRNNYIKYGHPGVAIWGSKEPNVYWDVSNISIHHNVFQDLNIESTYNFGVFINPTSGENYDNIEIYNNVFDDYDEGVQLFLPSGSTVNGTKIKNNIFRNVPNLIVLQGVPATGIELENNYYDNNLIVDNTNATYANINNTNGAAELNATGTRPSPFYEASSQAANVVDAGVDVGLPFSGTLPDIGAFEFGAPLPVEYVSLFSAIRSDDGVRLKWETATELNVNYFLVERSEDGTAWVDIAKINAFNTSHIYAILDPTSFGKIVYYRLKQVDMDSKFSYSDVVNITHSETRRTQVYPNPTQNIINIQSSQKLETIEVFNYLGKRIRFEANPPSFQIDLSEEPNGVYFLRVQAGFETTVHQIIVTH